MPLKDIICKVCVSIEENALVRMDESPSGCSKCGSVRSFMVSMPAKTGSLWGDNYGHSSNVNGTFDRGLGATYHNSRERESIMKAKGLIPLSDVGGDNFIKDRLTSEATIKAQQDQVVKLYKDKVSEYGGGDIGQVKAIEELFPARECLDGTGNSGIINANPFTGEQTSTEEI
jgi:hypothetical protein